MKMIGQISWIIFVLFRVVRCIVVMSNPLSLDDSSEIFAIVGGSHTLNATVSTANFADHSIIEIYHRNVLTSEETLLISMEDYDDITATTESGYSVVVTNVSATEKTVSFVIESLSFDDDGAIDFDIKSTTGQNNYTETRNITVVVIPDTVKINFGDQHEVDTNSSGAVKVTSGNITVYCIVEESNPEITDITLTLDGTELTLETGLASELISDDERKYSNNVSAIVEVPSDLNETRTLVCVAEDYNGDFHAIAFLYNMNSGPKGQAPVLGLVFLLAAFLLWHTI